MRYKIKRKKIKIFIASAFCGLLLIFGLITWASVSAVRYIASASHQAFLPVDSARHTDQLKLNVKSFSSFQPIDCLAKSQSLLAIQPWLEQSLSVIFLNLKTACFGIVENQCTAEDCKQKNDLSSILQDETI